MKWLNFKTIFAVFVTILLSANFANAQDGRNVAKYNLTDGLGLKGFDPVSYFPEGGAQVSKGLTGVFYEYEGVTYHFSSTENRDIFITNPEKYEPTYGGWCAYAMAFGSQVDIQPELFTIHGNRIHFFVSSRAKRSFDREITKFENDADKNWFDISGESSRN